ncbi:MAG: fatty acid desaturase, partial [Vicinamibacterales bacterium]
MSVQAVVLCLALYVVRMFVVTAGYHRYFSHRSFKTSRVFQFILGFLAQTSAQRGVLWWAAKHRHHHRHSDTELDVHSPRHKGFWYS